MIAIGSDKTQISLTWTQLKAKITTHSLILQYDSSTDLYFIYAYDGPQVFTCVIYRGTVPDYVVAAGYSQVQNDADELEFETSYQSTANARVGNVAIQGSSGSNSWKFTPFSSSGSEIGIQASPFWITGSVATSGGGGGTVVQGNAGSIAQSWYMQLTDGSSVRGTTLGNGLYVSGTFNQGTQGTSPWLVQLTSGSTQIGTTTTPVWITGSVATSGGGGGGTVTQGPSGSVPWKIEIYSGSAQMGVQALPFWITGSVASTGGSGGGSSTNPNVAGTGSVAPFSASLVGMVDLAGNLRAQRSDNNGSSYVSTRENSVTGTLGALNAAVTVALSGSSGVGFQLAAGTLVGTLSAETSYDNGTTWVATDFYDVLTKALSPTIVFASSNTAQTKGIIIPQGGGLTRVRVSAYTSGTANATIIAGSFESSILYVSMLDGARATYSAYTAAFTPAATATDIFIIQGSATKTIRVLNVMIFATQTTAAAGNIFLVKRSTANTGGTAVATTKVPLDSKSAASTATVQHYTVNPTTGTLVGNVSAYRGIIPASATLINNPIFNRDFGNNSGQAIVLRGTAQGLAVNLNSVTVTGGSFIVGIQWTEE
jgi:hypothetical protein